MRNESVYLTLAQVLPTLLIAVAIEARSMINAYGRLSKRASSILRDLDTPATAVYASATEKALQEARRRQSKAENVYVAVAATFVLGEAAALAGPLVGLDGWFAWVAGPIAVLAVAVMAVLAVVIPWRTRATEQAL
jgi:hypothetical protein